MDFKRVMNLVFLLAISHCLCSCVAYKFSVGGTDGWVLHPSEDYSHWSSRNRFLVNDTLLFKYKKGDDSVLEVKKDDYYNCNTSSFLYKNENGSSEFKLARSGPFFFISGVKDRCEKGQKLLLIVLSERHRLAAHSPGPLSEISPAPVASEVSSPGPSVEPSSAPSVAPTPGSSSEEDFPPVPVPTASQKAEASAMNSALPVLVLMAGSTLFLRAIM